MTFLSLTSVLDQFRSHKVVLNISCNCCPMLDSLSLSLSSVFSDIPHLPSSSSVPEMIHSLSNGSPDKPSATSAPPTRQHSNSLNSTEQNSTVQQHQKDSSPQPTTNGTGPQYIPPDYDDDDDDDAMPPPPPPPPVWQDEVDTNTPSMNGT